MNTTKQYIFGPVPSRRLGLSLGVDLVPFKTCSYDCLYCQLGRTTLKTVNREEYAPLEEILVELDEKLRSGIHADYITLSGAGEPSLHSGLGELIQRIRAITKIPIAVLTNGSLLWKRKVREEMKKADLVIPSLDAGSTDIFEKINRPHPSLNFEQMLDGLIQFSKFFTGKLWLEIFFLHGINTADEPVKQIIKAAEKIKPTGIHLNTIARPPAEPEAKPAGSERMRALKEKFPAPCTIAASLQPSRQTTHFKAVEEQITGLLQRRPCTVNDIIAGLGIHRNEAVKNLEYLLKKQKVFLNRMDNDVYYSTRKIG